MRIGHPFTASAALNIPQLLHQLVAPGSCNRLTPNQFRQKQLHPAAA